MQVNAQEKERLREERVRERIPVVLNISQTVLLCITADHVNFTVAK